MQGAYPSLIGSTPDDNSNPSDQPVQLHKMKKLNILLRFRIFKKNIRRRRNPSDRFKSKPKSRKSASPRSTENVPNKCLGPK